MNINYSSREIEKQPSQLFKKTKIEDLEIQIGKEAKKFLREKKHQKFLKNLFQSTPSSRNKNWKSNENLSNSKNRASSKEEKKSLSKSKKVIISQRINSIESERVRIKDFKLNKIFEESKMDEEAQTTIKASNFYKLFKLRTDEENEFLASQRLLKEKLQDLKTIKKLNKTTLIKDLNKSLLKVEIKNPAERSYYSEKKLKPTQKARKSKPQKKPTQSKLNKTAEMTPKYKEKSEKRKSLKELDDKSAKPIMPQFSPLITCRTTLARNHCTHSNNHFFGKEKHKNKSLKIIKYEEVQIK